MMLYSWGRVMSMYVKYMYPKTMGNPLLILSNLGSVLSKESIEKILWVKKGKKKGKIKKKKRKNRKGGDIFVKIPMDI